MSRKFCEFLGDSLEVEKFKRFYRHTFIADEGFFQTVIMNTSYEGTIVNDDKRTIVWVPAGTIKLRPRDFTSKDAEFLLASQGLFARKFDETVDAGIFSILELNLSQPLLIYHGEQATSASSRDPLRKPLNGVEQPDALETLE